MYLLQRVGLVTFLLDDVFNTRINVVNGEFFVCQSSNITPKIGVNLNGHEKIYPFT